MEAKNVLEQVRTLKFEFQALSSKKPNDTLNKFKVKYVNQTLTDANIIAKTICTNFQNEMCIFLHFFAVRLPAWNII